MPAEVYMMVGLPGSGKSTIAENWMRERKVDHVISSDAIRESMFGGDRRDFTREAEVWDVYHRRLNSCLLGGRRVALDSTNLQPDHRRQVIEACSAWGVKPVAVRMVAERPVVDARNAARGPGRAVPDEVMECFWGYWEAHCGPETLLAEGFVVVPVVP